MRSRPFMFVLAALVLLVTALVLSFWYTSTALTQSDSGSGSQTTTIDLGPGTLYVGPNLWGILYKEANNETVPANITAQIGVDPGVTVAKSLSDQITEAGGSHVRDQGRHLDHPNNRGPRGDPEARRLLCAAPRRRAIRTGRLLATDERHAQAHHAVAKGRRPR